MDEQTLLAINAATNRDWKAAIAANLSILKKNTKDIDALNRLGRAYFETGQKTKAEEIYKKVLRIDKFNTIASKNLNLLHTSRVARGSSAHISMSPPPVFLEEPGITKLVTLTRLGDTKIISRMHPGDAVKIAARDHCVAVTSQANEYLGRLPDDLASRLLPLIRGGNTYSGWIRSLESGLKIFIKEMSKHPKLKNTVSFPITERLSYAAFTPPELVHTEKPDITGVEEQEEYLARDDEPDNDDSAPQLIETNN